MYNQLNPAVYVGGGSYTDGSIVRARVWNFGWLRGVTSAPSDAAIAGGGGGVLGKK